MAISNTIEARIAERAYRIWESEGRPSDRHLEHWLQAEREVKAGATGESAGPSAKARGAPRPAGKGCGPERAARREPTRSSPPREPRRRPSKSAPE